MNAKRFYRFMLVIFAVLLVGSAGLTVFADSWLKGRSTNLVNTKLDIIALEKKQQYAQKAANELSKNKSTIALLQKIIPTSKDQVHAIAEIQQIASEVGISIGTLVFPNSDLGTVVKAPVATPEPDTGTSTKAASTAAATPAPAPTATPAPAITQAKPVEGIPNILGIEVNLSQIDSSKAKVGDGISYAQLLDLLERLEKNRRTMQIKNLQIQPITDDKNQISGYSVTLALNIFVKP